MRRCPIPVIVIAGLREGQTSGGGDIALSAAGGVLEVRLICHPLVTMAPDIRYNLRNSDGTSVAKCLPFSIRVEVFKGKGCV